MATKDGTEMLGVMDAYGDSTKLTAKAGTVYGLGIAQDPSPPVAQSFVPAVDSYILPTATLAFSVIDNLGQFATIAVAVKFTTRGRTELVHDGGGFMPGYQDGSSRVATGPGANTGYDYEIARDDGWPDDLQLVIAATDAAGNLIAQETYNFYLNTGYAKAPTVQNFVPAAGATIGKGDVLAFDVIDAAPMQRVILIAYFSSLRQPEVIHDGDGFVGLYTSSTRNVLSVGSGWRYLLSRSGGWPPGQVTIRPFAEDTLGMENA